MLNENSDGGEVSGICFWQGQEEAWKEQATEFLCFLHAT
jgi:hypothetical protein